MTSVLTLCARVSGFNTHGDSEIDGNKSASSRKCEEIQLVANLIIKAIITPMRNGCADSTSLK